PPSIIYTLSLHDALPILFEILGMVVFAVFLAAVHNQNGAGVIFQSSQAGNYDQFPAATTLPFFLVGMFMSLYVIYGFDTASTLRSEEHTSELQSRGHLVC